MKEVCKQLSQTDIHAKCQRDLKSISNFTKKLLLCFLLVISLYAVAYIAWKTHKIKIQLRRTEDGNRLIKFFSEEDQKVKSFEETDDGALKKQNDQKFLWSNHATNRLRRSISRHKKYVVSQQTHFVNCNRFKPVPRGKYLVPPSIDALHTCYKYGVRTRELDRGILQNTDGLLRYDLDNLYVPCEDVFNDHIDELTSDLREDYERCKWSGALDERQQRKIEERFAETLAAGDKPSNLIVNVTSPKSSSRNLDPRAFVECSHVETELFEDYFETPSLEALRRCQNFGVTLKELEKGLTNNPMQPAADVGDLYISCMDVFDGHVDYMTSELREDYRRCKSVDAIDKKVQMDVEKRFYEMLTDNNGRTEKTSTANTLNYETTTTTMTTKSMKNRYTFANCKRIENKPYLVCIKIIKVYSGSFLKLS